MHLYIANSTSQHVDFYYRVLEITSPRMQRIPIGGQIKISGDLSTPDIEHIINQHRPYGLVAADEVDRTKEFVGLCYSVGKPVPVIKIERAMMQNRDILTLRGRKIREETAIVSAGILENSLTNQDRPEQLRNFESSVVEENPDRRSDQEGDPFAEGVRVRRDAGNGPAAPPPEPGRAGRRGRRAA